jgi:hypothetical protein
MEKVERIGSVQEWMNLPEVFLPVIENGKGTGSIYNVLKVGFLAVSQAQCKQMGLNGVTAYGGKYILATAVVDFAGQRQLCRLPIGLTHWAFDCVALANSGNKPFPSKVEFGLLDGQAYAQFLS